MGKQVGCWLANNLLTRLLLIGNAAKLLLFEFANNLSTRQLVYSLTLSPPCVAVVSNNN